MKNKILTVFLSITIAIVVILLVFYAGILVQTQKTSLSEKTIKALSSNVISSIMAFGEVTNISDRTLTIAQEGESIDVTVAENAEISLYSSDNTVTVTEGKIITPARSKINFEEIKPGEFASVIIKLSSSGELKGISVSVFPKKGAVQ